MRRSLLVLAVTVVLVGACSSGGSDTNAGTSTTTESSGSSTSAPQGTASPSEAVEEVQQAIEEVVGSRPGGAVALMRRDGVTTTYAVGAANAAGDALEPEQPMRVGSISKPFVAAMVMQLVDEGSVVLDDPLSTYLPDTPVGADITIRQLLGHDSGIANYTDQIGFFDVVTADPTRAIRPEEMIDSVALRAPGTVGTFSYSNTNYLLLGQVLEAVDGSDLNTIFDKRITSPLGLTNTYFATADRPAGDDLAAAWSADFLEGGNEIPYTSIATSAWAAGSLVSTTSDLARFLDALFNEDLVTQASLAEMTFTGTDGYGLGLFQASLGEGQLGYAHGGSIPGYSSTMGIDPISGDTLVIVTNNDSVSAEQIAVELIGVW